ncbi:DNA alkylation repair protein [Curtobacterium ammoniigenes]|uniref:DNA alkylation repair protein n=1 Tax=Curtobacterium ammoniigenes TaxID=395387 RepID=UPI000836C4B3|nr:DNA alkylation repair protein [Curtobacterium ammoniigenes]
MRQAEDVIRALARTDGSVAAARRVARQAAALPDPEVDAIIWTGERGLRLVAVLLLVHRFRGGDDTVRSDVLERWQTALHAECLDSADLVDVSAEHILGAWYVDRNPNPLFALAKSDIVWERRAAVRAGQAFVKRGDAATALALAERLVRERGLLVQEPLGVLLREVGKRGPDGALQQFLRAQAGRLGPVAAAMASDAVA